MKKFIVLWLNVVGNKYKIYEREILETWHDTGLEGEKDEQKVGIDINGTITYVSIDNVFDTEEAAKEYAERKVNESKQKWSYGKGYF